MALTIGEVKLKQAYEQQRKAQELGMFCLKYGIEKTELQALAHDKLLKEEKRHEMIMDRRYEK